MIKLLLFLVFLAGLGVSASFLAENAGSVTMFWLDYRIETSVAFLIVLALLISIIMIASVQLLLAPRRFFRSITQKSTTKKLERAIGELTYSVAALAASDPSAAQAHNNKVENLLGRTPLTILLSAQIAKTKGDESSANALLEQLLLHKETNFLAARFLSDNASKHEDLPRALEFAKQARELNHKDSLAALRVISLHVRLKQWQEALAMLQKIRISRKERVRLQALINLAQAEELFENGNDSAALTLGKYAYAKLPDFRPAAELLARIYDEIGEGKTARRIRKIIIEKQSTIVDGGLNFTCKICASSQKKWGIHCNKCHGFDTLVYKNQQIDS